MTVSLSKGHACDQFLERARNYLTSHGGNYRRSYKEAEQNHNAAEQLRTYKNKSRRNVMQQTTTTAIHKHNVHLFTLLFEHSREQNLVQLWWKPMENARNDGSFQNDLAFDRVSEMAMKQIVSDRLRYIYNKNMFGRRS